MDRHLIVEVEDISVRRRDTCILSGVSWTIRQDEHWVILGPNGCGKTTLLKVLAGYEWPTSGSVMLLGERHGETDLRVLRRRIGWVSSALSDRHRTSETAHEVALSGIEASMGLWREFTPVEHTWADACLQRAGAGNLARKPWGVLSQGERQRTLIARALAAKPALLVLDEPCAGLDPLARERFLDDLDALARGPESPAIVLVTHHVEEIGPFITHALLMHEGEVLSAGPLDEQLTSAHMEALFGTRVDLQRNASGWTLRVAR